MRKLVFYPALILAAGCATAGPERAPGSQVSFVEARVGAPLANGRARVVESELRREPTQVRYKLSLRNVSDAPLRVRVRVRFFDDADVEFLKGEERWESRSLEPGATAGIAGVFAMPEPTRLAVTVLSE